MRHRLIALLLALMGIVVVAGCSSGGGGGSAGGATGTTRAVASTISVRSPAFQSGAAIPRKYSCSGDNVSPPLSWSGVPSGARKLALVVDDPDAGGFVHWVLVGIDPGTGGVAEDAVPPGAVEVAGYRGPCPPGGTHHYQFTVYALPQDLQIARDADPKDAISQIQAAATARGQLVGTFSAG